MIVSFKIFESGVGGYPTILYHGATTGHEFKGVNSVGTFFSTLKNFAIEYMGEWKGVTDGKLYEVIIKSNLKIFDTKDINDCTLLVNKFDELEDNIEDYGDDDSYKINTPEKLCNLNNTWFAIENEPDCLKWLEQQYDGVILFEDGIKNILLFHPVKEKIISFKEINKNRNSVKLIEESIKKREIYHFSESLDSLSSILCDDRLISGEHSDSRYGLGYENISFTWNPDLWDIIYAGDRDYRYKVKMCFDYSRMSKEWKFEPFDYGIPEEKEERIIENEINGINKYITKIYISSEYGRGDMEWLKNRYPEIKFYWARRKKFKEDDNLFEKFENNLDRYSIDDNWYLYKDGIRQLSSTSKSDLINYLKFNKPELIDKFNLSIPKDKSYKGIITLYRGHGYNEGNNFYSPSKEFTLEFTRTGKESELTKIKVDSKRIYRNDPLPRGYGIEDINFDNTIKKALELGFNAIWVDEGADQPNSVFVINPKKKI